MQDMPTNVVMRGARCTISGKLNQTIYDMARKMQGFYKWETVSRTLVFEPNVFNMTMVAELLPDANYCDDALKRLNEIKVTLKEAEDSLAARTLPLEATNFLFKTIPFQHQLEAFMLSKDKKNFAYLMEMGTGKTKVVIDVAAYLHAKGEIDTLIILAPNGVHSQWVDEKCNADGEPMGEIKKHMPEFIEYEMMAYKSGMGKKALARVDEILSITDFSKLRIFAINIESQSHKSGVDFLRRLLMSSKALLALDESSRIKNPGSLRTKSLIKLGELAPYKRIMSGSPVTQGLEDLYAQCKFLSPDILGISTMSGFKQRYCDEVEMTTASGIRFRKVVGYRNEDELNRKLSAWSYKKRKDECLDLPPFLPLIRYTELAPEQAKLYNTLLNNYLAEFEDTDGIIDGSLAMVRLLFLQRIICGHIKDDGDVIHRVPKDGVIPRVETCMEIVEEAIESDGKIIIWCRFRNDYAEIAAALEKRKIIFTNYLGKDKDQCLAEFKMNKDCRVMISNPRSGGIGLNITEANYMIYYSNTFSAEDRWQSIARTYRSGQKRKVTCIDIVAKDTVDEKILLALDKKEDIASIITNNPRKFLTSPQ